MAHVKEPKDVDFIIKSPPLTEQEKREIGQFIQKKKAGTAKIRTGRNKAHKQETAE